MDLRPGGPKFELMIVSWDWLKQYVQLEMPLEELTERLTMTGLNLDGVADVDGDIAIDLEVTSNRPDCLGHIGVAREISVLFHRELKIPLAHPQSIGQATSDVTSVQIECEDLCPRYFARVIRGAKIGPSPDWMQRRLKTLGIGAINNIVDITNYVLFECGQPLHAFDLDKLNDQRIVVRRPRDGETLVAINHTRYQLPREICVIADAGRAVAIGGIMGGLDTEISDRTTNVLIEAADFSPVAIRSTARKLNLNSPSSHRFERGIDACWLDWSSRRCCELILELAGGELLDEAAFSGTLPADSRVPVTLRFNQIPRILGIDITPSDTIDILTNLGLKQDGEPENGACRFEPPSWRRDLMRESDLIEEVARIHGYEKIPEDVNVPLQLSEKTHHDRVVERVRDALIGAGIFEAITLSFISEDEFELFTPRHDFPMLRVDHSSRRHENIVRQSLIPSLLKCRRENERRGSFDAQLFEISNVFLATEPGNSHAEPTMIGIISGNSFGDIKGVIETLAYSVNHSVSLTVRPCGIPQFVPGRGAEVFLDGICWGWLGEISRDVSDKLDLRDAVVVAELDLSVLKAVANLTPTYSERPRFPAVARDLNFLLDEDVTWQQLESVVHDVAGPLLESVSFGGQFRGKQIGSHKKSYVITINYRSRERTLTNEEVEQSQKSVIQACENKLGASLH